MLPRFLRKEISLKWLLAGTILLGTGVGFLGRLLTNDPRTFHLIVSTAAKGAPYVALGGGVLFSALRPRSRWRAPYCAACQQPLDRLAPQPDTACDACGTSITRLDQIAFDPVPRREWGMLGWLAVAVLVPLAIWWVLSVCLPHGRLYARIATHQLINDHLAAEAGGYLAWSELARRLDNDQLTREDADAMLETLTRDLSAAKKGRRSITAFASPAILDEPKFYKLVSSSQLATFANAAYQPKLQLGVAPPHWGRNAIEVGVTSPTLRHRDDVGLSLSWDFLEVTQNGGSIQPAMITDQPTMIFGGHAFQLPPAVGDQKMAIKVRVVCTVRTSPYDPFNRVPYRRIGEGVDPVQEWTLAKSITIDRGHRLLMPSRQL